VAHLHGGNAVRRSHLFAAGFYSTVTDFARLRG
jgi:hypothetical protein